MRGDTPMYVFVSVFKTKSIDDDLKRVGVWITEFYVK